MREFQSVGPETAKHLRPYLIVLERGTARSPRTAERRRPRLADSETGEHSSARYMYAGAARYVSRLVRVHTDSYHNGHNKIIFAVSYV